MNKLQNLLWISLVAILLAACSDNEPSHIDPQIISGTWYMTNIRGWEYDEDAKGGKSEFNETFNFNGQGIPVGDNNDDAQKITFSFTSNNTENGSSILDVTSYYWGFNENIRDWEWKSGETGSVTLQGNKLIDGTMEVTITKLTDRIMTTYQKDEDGETYVTYTRL